jgi:hypothetical protein
MEGRDTRWFCINQSCGFVLGRVLGSELEVSEEVTNLQTRGVNLAIKCPSCDTVKVWYTADPIVRAIYQLIDTVTTVSAERMVKKVSRELQDFSK